MLMASPRSGPNHRLLRTARPASLNSRLQRPILARERSSFGRTAVRLAAEPTGESSRSLLCRCNRIFTTFAAAMGKGRGELSERGADAAFGGNGAALVGHHRALDRAEHRDGIVGMVVEAG